MGNEIKFQKILLCGLCYARSWNIYIYYYIFLIIFAYGYIMTFNVLITKHIQHLNDLFLHFL